MTMMLKNVVNEGTASLIKLKETISTAGKTGTSSNNEDKWFIGYTPYYVCGVWTGYDTPKYMSYAKNPSCIMFDAVMEYAHRNVSLDKDFNRPFNVVEKEFCFDSGLVPSNDCLGDLRGNRIEVGYYNVLNYPKVECDKHKTVYIDSIDGNITSSMKFWRKRRVSLIDYKRQDIDGVAVLDDKYLICNRKKN